MPPPDTLIITAAGDTVFIPDPVLKTNEYLINEAQPEEIEQDAWTSRDHPLLTVSVIVFIGLFFYIVINKVETIPQKIINRRKKNKLVTLLATNGNQYNEWLEKYNPYYRALSEEFKFIFLQRVVNFKQSKIFRFHSMSEEEYIPVLVSGAAVQMTFGLRNYLMEYYPVIHIIRKEYVLSLDKETYYGHVSRSGIYIAWNHFMDGYEDYTDSVNVGLHEMAHAVSFDVFLGETDHHDYAFKKRLADFAEEGKPIFRAMRQGATHILDEYAATNFDEFWAVCIETFFENPAAFQQAMPDLYQSIVELLNQDTLNPAIIADRGIAGL